MTGTTVEILQALDLLGLPHLQRRDGGYQAHCPACTTDTAIEIKSLTVSAEGLLQCDEGCDPDEIAARLHLALERSRMEVEVGRVKLRELDVQRMLRTEPPPVEWLIEPLCVRGNMTMIAGREGLGKSMLGLAAAAAMGNGTPIAGMETKPGRVLVVDAENGEHEAHRRVRGLEFKGGSLVYVEADGFSLRHDLSALVELIERHRPDLLVLDSFRALAPGLDENDSARVDEALTPLRNAIRALDTACLLLHHTGKGGHEYRGSTAIGAAVELGFTLSRIPEDPEARRRRKLACWKCRPAQEPEARWLTLDSHYGLVMIDEADPYEPEQAERAPARSQLVSQFVELIDQHERPMRLAELCQQVGREKNDGTARRALAGAVEAGDLVKCEDGGYARPDWCQPATSPRGFGTWHHGASQLGTVAGTSGDGR